MENKNKSVANEKRKKNSFLLIFVCIFLGISLILGATLGIIVGVSEAKAVASYNGIRVDRQTASYLASYYKYRYMTALSQAGVSGVRDTERFWSTASEEADGVTYGELLSEGTVGYIKGIIAANYLYSRYGKLTATDNTRINNAVKQVLDFKANSDKAEFNDKAAEFGFDYSSFRSAVELLYKANRVSEIIWGSDGSGLANSVADCEAYLDTYSHVKLLFIRTETALVSDGEGGQTEVALSELQKEERRQLIAKIDSEIEGYNTGADLQMSPVSFDSYIAKHDEGVAANRNKGYYFHASSAYTAEFAEAFPEVVSTALDMQIGEYKKAEVSIGVCYIYKYESTAGDYLVYEDGTFSDFYLNGAAYMYTKILEELSSDVNIKESYSAIDPVTLPYNSDLIAKFS